MDIREVVKMYNDQGLTIAKISENFGVSKSTVSRLFARHGYVFDKANKRYVRETICSNTINNETINTVNNETINTFNNKKVKTVKCTFDLPEELHRKLKVKCAIEGLKMVDFIRDLLEKNI